MFFLNLNMQSMDLLILDPLWPNRLPGHKMGVHFRKSFWRVVASSASSAFYRPSPGFWEWTDFERRDFDLLVFALLGKLEKLKSLDEESVMGTLSWGKPRYPYYVLCDTHVKTDKRRPVFFSYWKGMQEIWLDIKTTKPNIQKWDICHTTNKS